MKAIVLIKKKGMKKLAIFSVFTLFAFSLMAGQTPKSEKGQGQETKKEQKAARVPLKKLEGNVVSDEAKKNFILDFSDVKDAQWKRSGTFDEVTFTKDHKQLTAYYDSGGMLVGTTSAREFSDLPDKGRQEIKSKYKDYTVNQVIFYDDNESNPTDMILWATQFDDEDLYFVELAKGINKIVVMVTPAGKVSMFKQL